MTKKFFEIMSEIMPLFDWLIDKTYRSRGQNLFQCNVNDLINARGVYLIIGVQAGAFNRRLKETDVYCYNCNKLTKTKNVLSAKILRKFKNSGISTPSIDTPWPSRDPYRSFKSQHRCKNPRSGLLCGQQHEIRKALLIKHKTELAEWFCSLVR